MGKEDLRQAILDNSYKTLTEEGVMAIRMRDLAKACNCSVGTLYNVFNTFEEIHFHLNLRTFKILFTRLFATLKQAEESNTSLEEILPALGWEYIAFAKEETHSWKALFEQAPEGNKPSWYREELTRHFGAAEESIERIFVISREKAEKLISYFWFAIHGVCSIVLNKKSTNHSDEFVKSYVDHCLRGIYRLVE